MIKKQLHKKAFSLIELSIASIIIAILIAGIISGKRLIDQSKLQGARALTKTSAIQSIPDLTLWLETTLNGSITGTVGDNNLSNGDLISSWNDISFNKINLTQATTAQQPKYLTSGINGLPSLSFDGVDDNLFSLKIGSGVPISAGDDSFTLVALWSKTYPATGVGVLFEQNTNGSSISGQRAAMLTLSASQYGFNGESNNFHNVSYSAFGSMPITSVITVSDAGNVRVYTNSNTPTSGSINATTQNVSDVIFMVGAKALSTRSDNFNGRISEIMVFNRNLNTSEVTIIQNYLSKKYNITLS